MHDFEFSVMHSLYYFQPSHTTIWQGLVTIMWHANHDWCGGKCKHQSEQLHQSHLQANRCLCHGCKVFHCGNFSCLKNRIASCGICQHTDRTAWQDRCHQVIVIHKNQKMITYSSNVSSNMYATVQSRPDCAVTAWRDIIRQLGRSIDTWLGQKHGKWWE